MKKFTKYFITIIVIFAPISICFGLYFDQVYRNILGEAPTSVEVVFVTAKKDFSILPTAVKAVEKYLQNPVERFVLVSPNTPEAIEIARANNMHYMDENKILDFNTLHEWIQKNNLKLNHPRGTSWYYQQFLKLFYSKHTSSKNYVIVDADLVLERPLNMISEYGITTFLIGKNSGHEISKKSIAKLLGPEQFIPSFSYIADMMCFKTEAVISLIKEVEEKFNQPFHQAAIMVEQGSDARFSEYELYGVYYNFRYKPPVLSNYLINRRKHSIRPALLLKQYIPWYKKYAYIAYDHYVTYRNSV